jgi:hypothetical protein
MVKRGRKKRITNQELGIMNDNGEVKQAQTTGGLISPQERKSKKIKSKTKQPRTEGAASKSWQVASEKQAEEILLEIEKEKEKSREPKLELEKEQARPAPAKTEQRNRLITWAGISCIMVALLVVWSFGLKQEFKASVKKDNSSGFDWSQAKSELDKTIKQVKQGLEQIKQLEKNTSSALPKETSLTTEQLNVLKGKLLEETATTTASSAKE